MTFEEAADKKQFLSSTKLSERGILMHLHIVPEDTADLIRYLKDFEHGLGNDRNSIPYSSDGKFQFYYSEVKSR